MNDFQTHIEQCQACYQALAEKLPALSQAFAQGVLIGDDEISSLMKHLIELMDRKKECMALLSPSF